MVPNISCVCERNRCTLIDKMAIGVEMSLSQAQRVSAVASVVASEMTNSLMIILNALYEAYQDMEPDSPVKPVLYEAIKATDSAIAINHDMAEFMARYKVKPSPATPHNLMVAYS